MPVLDFKEIPDASAGPDRDAFELFARDFLSQYGYEVVSGPDRGIDGGRDIIIKEERIGIGGKTVVEMAG